MKMTKTFMIRNFKEMLRDPVIYIFCLGFPLLMIIMFQVINNFTAGNTPIFLLKSLIPGILVFSFTFVMLTMTLLISKDRSTMLLKRLYSSPMKSANYIVGYAVPGFVLGFIQAIICVLCGFIISLINHEAYFSFGKAILLIISQLPILIFCVFLGLLIGSSLNEKAAPGIVSVIITAAGLLGGAWMPLDTMGKFEKFCRFLPFHPSIYIGRVITGATKTINGCLYEFDKVAAVGLIVIALYIIAAVLTAILIFKKQMTSEK